MHRNIFPAAVFLIFCLHDGSQALSNKQGDISIHLNNEGTFGGRTNSDFLRSAVPLNNHGFFYNGSSIICSWLEAFVLTTRLRIWNEEISLLDQFEFQFEPEITLHFPVRKWKFTLQGGYINDVTLGSGLTVKDLSNSGFILNLCREKWSGSVGILARGYGMNEDLYCLVLDQKYIPLKFSVLAITTQGTELSGPLSGDQYHISAYLLPNTEIKLPFGLLYAEYGFKSDRKNNVAGIIEENPPHANAGLIGFKTDFQGRRLSIGGCLEFRAYQKGFIPVTGVDPSRFGKFWDEEDSRANWIDFFDCRETSYWGYLQLHGECIIAGDWRLFARDEILFFHSKQKEAIVFPSNYDDIHYNGAVMQYTPSSHYYAAGIRYQFIRKVTGELSIGNKLRNVWRRYHFPYTQWGQRFIASEHPYLEARLKWNF